MQEIIHELWLIYKEWEEHGPSEELRQRLGKVINQLNRLPAALGAKGGAVKSEAKREAARDNGTKGGAPNREHMENVVRSFAHIWNWNTDDFNNMLGQWAMPERVTDGIEIDRWCDVFEYASLRKVYRGMKTHAELRRETRDED